MSLTAAEIAQSVERLTSEWEVVGSTPGTRHLIPKVFK